jgi:hypothetical protein
MTRLTPRKLRKRNPLVAPTDHVNAGLLAAGLLLAGATLGRVGGSTRTGITATMATGLVAGVFSRPWREVAFATSAFGAAALLFTR